jgi:signal transduction histidine kinase
MVWRYETTVSSSEMTTFLRLCAAGLLALGCVARVSAQESQTVLVLYSEQWLGPATASFTQTLRESLVASPTVQLEAQYLDISRFGGDAHDRALAHWLRSRYAGRRLAAVLALGVPASVFATRFGEAIWPGARITHASIDGEQARVAAERGDPVIRRVFQYRRTVEWAMDVFPAVRQVWLIAGSTEQDRRWLAIAAADLTPLNNRIRIEAFSGLRWDDLIAKVRQMPPDAVALGVLFGADADGRNFVVGDALRDVARAANRPFLAVSSWSLGSGAIGGYVVDAAEIGRLGAGMIMRVLNNPGAPNHPQVETAAGQWVFDAVQLRRWNIDESRLPAGSLVLNRELPAWRRYFWTVVATVLLVTAQGAVIGALLVQRRNRRRVEAALRLSEEKARGGYDEVRDLAGRLISAREGERARIARDLHDDIGQRVASFSIALSRIQRQIPDVSNPARQSVSDLEHQATQLSADLRHLSHELHPSALEHLGLLEALRERCDDFGNESGVPVRLDVSEAWPDVSDALALCLYRVVQEALRNVATHARARNVTISLDQLDGHLTLQVTDDGRGFDPTATTRRSGLGLISLSERVRMLGGELEVTAATHAGTRLAVRLPIGESHAS